MGRAWQKSYCPPPKKKNQLKKQKKTKQITFPERQCFLSLKLEEEKSCNATILFGLYPNFCCVFMTTDCLWCYVVKVHSKTTASFTVSSIFTSFSPQSIQIILRLILAHSQLVINMPYQCFGSSRPSLRPLLVELLKFDQSPHSQGQRTKTEGRNNNNNNCFTEIICQNSQK